jgi:glucose/mannose-6-phosphate isomerase
MISQRPQSNGMGGSLTTLDRSSLDAPATYERFDPMAFGDLLLGLPAQSEAAWALGEEWAIPSRFNQIDRTVIFGIGGSAAGGDIIAALAAISSRTSVQVVRGYTSPVVNGNTLAVASSFSGDTAETIAAFQAASEMGAQPLVVSAGGRLLSYAQEHQLPTLTYSWPGPPRSAFGYSLYPLLAVLSSLGIVKVTDEQRRSAQAMLEQGAANWQPTVPEADNLAKQIARRTAGTVPIILAPNWLAASATRWAAQINENAKQVAFALPMPEATHNFVEGHNSLNGQFRGLRAILLTSRSLDPRDQRVVKLLHEALESVDAGSEIVEISGDPLTSLVASCYLGDWVSYYVAVLTGRDPTPIQRIETLKGRLSEPD